MYSPICASLGGFREGSIRELRIEKMSLSLLQGYSSAEEEDDQQPQHPYLQNSDEDEEDDDEDEDEQNDKEGAIHDKSFIKLPIPSSGSGSSGLPSVLDLFSEVHLSLSLSLWDNFAFAFFFYSNE